MISIPFDAREMAEIRSKISTTELITPTNYLEEKQKWLDNERKFFNPKFAYDEEAIKDAIRKIDLLAPIQDIDERCDFFNYYGRFAYESLMKRCEELKYLKEFLVALTNPHITPNDHPENPLYNLYGDLMPDDIAFAKIMIEKGAEEAYGEGIISNAGTRTDWGADRRKWFFEGTLRSLKGTFSKEEKERLKAMGFDANEIAKYFQLVLDYMRKNSFYGGEMMAEEKKNPTYYIEISPKYTAVSVNAFSASGKSVIGIPADRKVNGLKLIELVGHELNSYYRSAMSTRAYFRDLLDPLENTCPILPLIPMMSHSLNETLSEGLAKVSDVKISGKSGLPKPYQVLAIDFAQQGHNFKETMEYVFELTRANHKTENTALNNAWNYTYRIFRGQRDTSSRSGYVFPKDKVYLCGFTTVVRSVGEWHTTSRHFESFMSLLRYSTLTIEELDSLDAAQSAADYTVGHDSYSRWDYNDMGLHCGYSLPDPVEYVTNLLLD